MDRIRNEYSQSQTDTPADNDMENKKGRGKHDRADKHYTKGPQAVTVGDIRTRSSMLNRDLISVSWRGRPDAVDCSRVSAS